MNGLPHHMYLIGTCLTVTLVGAPACSENDPSQASNPLGELDAGEDDLDVDDDESAEQPAEERSLKTAYADYFPIGVAVEPDHLDGDIGEILRREFNRLTAENVMKLGPIHPFENTYAFEDADQIARFAVAENMTMTGHALVTWRQNPIWIFGGGLTPGTDETVEVLKARLKAHIETLVEQYYDVVDNWDVVNEAISDVSGAGYRTDSKWYRYFGSEEYIYWAFRYTKDALEAVEPGGSVGKLYYNDYNVNQKRDGILEMLAWLENDMGIRIDGVGMQAHWLVGWPSILEIKGTIHAFADAGYGVKISELDISGHRKISCRIG